jgi:hypothetical protein
MTISQFAAVLRPIVIVHPIALARYCIIGDSAVVESTSL